MEFYRTFIALPVEVGEKTRLFIDELKRSLAGERISWVGTDRFHITLRFLGDTPLGLVEKIAGQLQNGILSEPFPLFMSDLGSFGPRKHPRVLFIGWKPSGHLEAVYRATGKILSDCGVPAEGQPFRAHLTLGRVRGLRDPETFYRTIEMLRGREMGEVLVDRLIYFRSELGPGSPVYTPITEVGFMDREGPR
jgi:2'-5' RNA ligase